MRALYWIRNDMRIRDNAALTVFCEQAAEGLVVWCANASFQRAGERRRSFILGTLEEFSTKLRERGVSVLISLESASEVIPDLVARYGIATIFVSAECAPEERHEESLLANKIAARFVRVPQATLVHTDDLPFALQDTPEIFTQFRLVLEKNLHVRDPLPEPTRWPAAMASFLAAPWHFTPTVADHPQIAPGETAGLARVQDYIWQQDCLRVYKETRNGLLAWNDSSKFSPWLSVGALSPRSIYGEVLRYEEIRCKNESSYWLFFELLWRDYFRFILEKKQKKFFGRRLELSDSQAQNFERWRKGESGNDFIDANMRELNQTSWMSNRGRQNVASYLAKELGVPWQYGADHFERELLDYDVANNWGNWSYLAGVGQDPRNRRFNIARQAELYDPEGEYRARWLKPECPREQPR